MKKQEIKNEWQKLVFECIQSKPDIEGTYPPHIVKNRELLLLGQIELAKIEVGDNINFHTKIYQTIMNHYFQQKKCMKT